MEEQKETKKEQQAQIARKYRRTCVTACSLLSKFYDGIDSAMIVQIVRIPDVQSTNWYNTESVDCLLEFWKCKDDKQADLQEGMLK